MKFGSPCPEIFLYITGMLLVTFGFGALVISIDPRPFDSNSWSTFLYTGIILLAVGGTFIVLTATIPEIPSKKIYCFGESNHHSVHASAVDLLEDVQSIGCADSPIVQLREAELRLTEESVRTVRSCMMMQSLAGSDGILFYKETVV